MNPRAEGPSLPSGGLEHKGDHGCGWEWEGVFDSAVVVSFGGLYCFSGCIRDFNGVVPLDVVLASGIHHGDINPERLGTDNNWDVSGYPLGRNEVCSGSSAGKSLQADGVIGEAETLFRIVFEDTLDLIVCLSVRPSVRLSSVRPSVCLSETKICRLKTKFDDDADPKN